MVTSGLQVKASFSSASGRRRNAGSKQSGRSRVRAAPATLRFSLSNQQLTPKRLSGVLPLMLLSFRVTGTVVNRPPPWIVIPGSPPRVGPVDLVPV